MKHVFLFISGLYGIDDEANLLREIHEGLKHSDARTVEGFRKDDFEILWVPIVVDDDDDEDPIVVDDDDDEDSNKRQFEKMKWYVVVDYSVIPSLCKGLIRERLKYPNNNPIVPVFNPQGGVTYDDAFHMWFSWGLSAFPWRKGDDLPYLRKWNWFWTDVKKS